MSKMAELDWDTREDEQEEMESDPHYINWLNQFDEMFAIETEMLYNTSIDTGENNGASN